MNEPVDKFAYEASIRRSQETSPAQDVDLLEPVLHAIAIPSQVTDSFRFLFQLIAVFKCRAWSRNRSTSWRF